MHRALLPGMALGLGMGCAGGTLAPLGPWPLVPAAVLLALALVLRSAPLIWAALLCVGWALSPGDVSDVRLVAQLPLLREVRGVVASLPEHHEATISFRLWASHLGAAFLVYAPRDADVAPGDEVSLRGRCEVPAGGWGRYLRLRGISGVFWAEGAEVVAPGRSSLWRWFHRIRAALLSAMGRACPGEAGATLRALLLGARGELEPGVREGFRHAGVAHLLALSGLHLGIIAYGLWRALGLFRLRRDVRYLIAAAVVALYVPLAGARISLVRAGIMFGFLGLFEVLWERGLVLRDWYDPLQGLSAAAILVLLIWPWSALDLGFQLSFAATGGIILGWPLWRDSRWRAKLPRFLRSAGDLLWVSLCAQGATLGFVGSAFGHISPYGILANLFLIPWTGLIIWAGVLLLALSPLGLAAALGGAVGRYLVDPYLAAVRFLAGLPGATLPVGRHFGLWCAFAALVFTAFWSCRRG